MAMSDNTSLVALVVAVVALAIASIQLTQQLLATGYVIRKCDRIATGGLTKGGTRKWHWRQFRFTVKYQAIVFSLPPSLYGSLGLKPAIQVAHYDLEIANRARSARPRRSPAQGCWVSLVQDLVHFSCLNPQHIGLSAESGDRIPDDLTVAPTKIDAITVLLCSIAMGMQVFKYSPTTGEVVLGGGSRSISSSAHPILGGLLHYSFFSNQPVIGKARAMRHGRALRNDKGVWANAVFGMFRDRSFRPGFQTLEDLRPRWKKLVLQEGWPNEGLGEDASRAACFLTFAYVDYYIVAPPSVSRYGCVSFAEAILKMQHWEILLESFTINKVDAVYDIGESFRHSRSDFVNFWGCSSPFLPWPQCDFPFLLMDHERDAVPDYERFLVFSALLEDLKPFRDAYGTDRQRYKKDLQDPSSYISPEVAWEMIQRLDQC
ncbi:hypothetical protein MMC10_011410, partial [Thelotrema lepadinum]|nr:hypothetical protein [Thelotrema lepadinum]